VNAHQNSSKKFTANQKSYKLTLIKVKYGTIQYMKARLTYIPLEVADKLDDFIISRDIQVMDAVKARTRDFSTLTLIKLLYQLSCRPMTFSDLYASSKIRMKRSFLNYLHLCLDYNFVKRETTKESVYYTISDKGRIMLGLFLQKSN
jgi:hypothetical protein